MQVERNSLLWQKLKKIDSLWLLFAVTFFFFVVLRFWYVTQIAPSALNQDESAILLNARFIAEDGKDEYGTPFPIVFPSFGDAKLPGYIYTTAFLWQFLPLDFIVRVPAFAASLFLPLLAARIIWLVTHNGLASFFTAVFLMLSPWTYHFGSVGFEAQLGLTLLFISLCLWLKRKATLSWDLLGAFFLFFSCLTYNAPLIVAPGILAAIIVYRGWNGASLRVASFGLVALVLAVFLTFSASSQKSGIAFFQDASVLSDYPIYRAEFSGLFQKLLGNQWVYFAKIFITNIASSFSWRFLVQQGGSNPWHGIPHTGHLHFLIPLLSAIGLGTMIRIVLAAVKMKNGRNFLKMLSLFALGGFSLLPAAITTDAPHATRSLFFFVLLSMLAGWQLSLLFDLVASASQKMWHFFLYLGGGALLFIGFFLWWCPAPTNWQSAHPFWYQGLEEALSQPEVLLAERVYIKDPEGVLYTRVANYEKMSLREFLDSKKMSLPAPTGLHRGESLGKYVFVFDESDAKSPGVYLEQQNVEEWSNIEI